MTSAPTSDVVHKETAEGAPSTRSRILVVSEDPFFVEEARAVLEWTGASVVSCLGPAHARCDLYFKGSCPLARRARIALVDAPTSGRFRYHGNDIQAGRYAEDLQRAHSRTHVFLCGAPLGASGPTGEVAVTPTRSDTLDVLTRLLRAIPQQRTVEDNQGGRS